VLTFFVEEANHDAETIFPMTPRADLVAQAVLTKFDQLPAKRKPSIRQNGLHEWIPLSAIVAEREGGFHCLALA
jgi:tRNA-specific adenosine deaminase 1